MKNTALIIGAGKIGRGFIAQLLQKEGWKIAFSEYSKELVESLNKEKKYTSHILGCEEKSTIIKNYDAFYIGNESKFNELWKKSDLIFTAVGGKNLQSIASMIAKAFKNNKNQEKNIILCENWKDPVKHLKTELLNSLNSKEKEIFKEKIGISEAVVMRVSVDPPENIQDKEKLDTWGNDFWELPINKENFLGNPIKFKNINFIDNFSNFLERKMYTNNTSNAIISYLGYQKGYKYTADAANDPQISKILDKAYKSINQMIVKEYGVNIKEQEAFSQQARAKYSDKAIIDSLYRHAADPIRKLSPDDRLIQPAQLMLKHGIDPSMLIKTIIAALYYDYPKDKIALKLKKIRKENGTKYILKNICMLKKDERLFSMIIEEEKNMSLGGML